jgi:molecular chaperone DnaK (HSP70)
MEPKIEVGFRIDENGILSVRARDAESGAQQGIRIEDPLGLQQLDPAPEDERPDAGDRDDDDAGERGGAGGDAGGFDIER